MKITEYQISEALEFGAYARGKKYFQTDQVESYKIIYTENEFIHLTGIVKGSYKSSYQQDIEISKSGYMDIKIAGDCSCPVSFNCKHVAAICFQYQFDETNKPKDAIDDWLSEVTELSMPDDDNKKQNNHFIHYRLFNNNNKGSLLVYQKKILKNGNLNKGGIININDYSYQWSLYDYMDKTDIIIKELLKNITDRHYNQNSKVEFKDETGFILLKKIISTNRCFYKESMEPLSLIDKHLELNFEWTSIDKTNYKLSTNIDFEKYHFIGTMPLLLIDKENNKVIYLDSNLEPQVINKLLEAPPIPQQQQAKVYQVLSDKYKHENFPAPKDYKITTIDEPLIPVLLIFQETHEKGLAYGLEFQIKYGEHNVEYIPKSPVVSQFTEKGKTDIIRNIAAEDLALNILENYGFIKREFENKLYMSIPIVSDIQQALQEWNDFLNIHIANLKKAGWEINFDEDFQLQFNNESEIIVESENNNDWFSLSFDIKFGGRSYPLVPLVSSILNEFDELDDLPSSLYLDIEDSNFVKINTVDIKPILNTIYELYDRQDKDNNLVVSAFDAHMIEDMEKNVTWKGSKEILKLSKKLKDFKGITQVKPPKCLQLELRDYQQQGLNWLNFLYKFKFSGILADDMGLGKTVQTLAHLSRLKQLGKLKKPCLIIVPTSLIANWKNEVKKFTPNLNILTLYGPDRFSEFEKINQFNLVLTTYALVVRDQERYNDLNFMYVILDEAQKIKNPKTKMAKQIATLKSEYRLALSGTPIENHLGELWSIFNFLMPGFLHNQSLFNSHYRNPIEKEYDSYRQQQLNKRIKPFILRRTKDDVLAELPPKTEIIKYTQFENKQSKLYESIRISMEKKVRDAISDKGLNRSHIHILDALLKLRQVCCHPSLLKLAAAKKVKDSAKLQLFLDLIDELLQEDKKILVFSQFTSMLTILEREIKKRKISYVKLTGASTKRDKIIDKFTNGEADIFLISLKAGGVGLNLVEADTVIHYDPWWNPAVENQATDRAHRIGQDKAVFVYKLIIENTIEQKILELQKKKKALQKGIYDNGGKLEDKKFSGSELMDLLKN